ncbi:MAG: hypothetical protein IPF78_10355 [Flavobacteriales bacterium]|nr:hypothetical protein [Flavobacteriales bacterium]
MDNGFPFSAAIELAIVDEADQVLTVLYPGGAVSSGILGSDGTVSASVSSRLDFDVSSDQMDLLQAIGKVRISAIFNTADQSQHTVAQ